MNRAQPFAEYLAEGWFNIFVWRNKIGEIWGNFLQKSAKNGVFRLETGQKRLFFEKPISLWLRHSLLTRASRALPCRGFPLAGSGRSRLRRTIAIPFLTNPATPAIIDSVETKKGLQLSLFSFLVCKSRTSHGYHILYKECASKYNIWFLFYMAHFTLPQFGERIGVKTRIKF